MAAKSIITEDTEHCFICGAPYPETHHIIYGWANRKLSDQYGLTVPLCARHHRGTDGVHQNRLLDLQLKEMAQERFEAEIGNRNVFRNIFGRSYI